MYIICLRLSTRKEKLNDCTLLHWSATLHSFNIYNIEKKAPNKRIITTTKKKELKFWVTASIYLYFGILTN